MAEEEEADDSVGAAACGWLTVIRGRLPGPPMPSGSLRFTTNDVANTRLGGARLLMRGLGAGAAGFGAGSLKGWVET